MYLLTTTTTLSVIAAAVVVVVVVVSATTTTTNATCSVNALNDHNFVKTTTPPMDSSYKSW